MKNLFLVFLLIWFGFTSNSYSADFQKGIDAVEIGDFSTALKVFRPLAEQGNPVAQYMLGLMYFKGDGVIEDHKEAAKWYRLAAGQGHIYAQSNLGMLYARGIGVIENKILAFMWFDIAASQGDYVAKLNVNRIVTQLTESQIEKAEDLARQCVKSDYKECFFWE